MTTGGQAFIEEVVTRLYLRTPEGGDYRGKRLSQLISNHTLPIKRKESVKTYSEMN